CNVRADEVQTMRIEFTPDQSLDELILQAQEDVLSWTARSGRQRELILASIPESQQHSMKRDSNVTLRFLRDDDDRQRLAALYLVYSYWISHPQFVEPCLHLAFFDPVDEIRGLALLCLPRLRDYIDDSRNQLRSLLQAVQPGENTSSECYEIEAAI